MGEYVDINYVFNQVGALARQRVLFTSVFVECTLGTITVIVNGVSFPLTTTTSVLDEGFQGKTFEVTGSGTWHGFLRGRA